MTQAQKEEKGHRDKRQRHCDTVVTEGNGDTKQSLDTLVVKHISKKHNIKHAASFNVFKTPPFVHCPPPSQQSFCCL